MGDNEYLDDLRKQESEIAACWNLLSSDQRHVHFQHDDWYHHDSLFIQKNVVNRKVLEATVSCFSL